MLASDVEGLTLGGFDFAALQADEVGPSVMNESEEDEFDRSTADEDEEEEEEEDGGGGVRRRMGRRGNLRRSSQIFGEDIAA